MPTDDITKKREAHAAYMREWYKKHPGYNSANVKQWRDKNPGARDPQEERYRIKNREAIAERERKHRVENREKVNAMQRVRGRRFDRSEKGKLHNRVRRAVRTALAKGILVRPDRCSFCGKVGPVQAHHASYAWEDRLKVDWPCIPCHRKTRIKEKRQLPVSPLESTQ